MRKAERMRMHIHIAALDACFIVTVIDIRRQPKKNTSVHIQLNAMYKCTLVISR
jgi:hypothetical protein